MLSKTKLACAAAIVAAGIAPAAAHASLIVLNMMTLPCNAVALKATV